MSPALVVVVDIGVASEMDQLLNQVDEKEAGAEDNLCDRFLIIIHSGCDESFPDLRHLID